MSKFLKISIAAVILMLSFTGCAYKTASPVYQSFTNAKITDKSGKSVAEIVDMYVYTPSTDQQNAQTAQGSVVGTLINHSNQKINVNLKNLKDTTSSSITLEPNETRRIEPAGDSSQKTQSHNRTGQLTTDLNGQETGSDLSLKLTVSHPSASSKNLQVQIIDKNMPGYKSAFPNSSNSTSDASATQ